MKYIYGLLGKNIAYSFSKKYFTTKFIAKNITAKYLNFDVEELIDFLPILDKYIYKLKGFNITIPYKTTIFKYLDEVDAVAEKIGAVNTVKIIDKTYLKGYNTDYYGFKKSLEPLLLAHHKNALILGNGGAAKAIKYALEQLNINYITVSRSQNKNNILYKNITKSHIKNAIIINCTPLGTDPNINECPAIPYQHLTNTNLLYDLVYNPLETKFLKKGKQYGAITKNGLEMLTLQAEKSWEIWNQ